MAVMSPRRTDVFCAVGELVVGAQVADEVGQGRSDVGRVRARPVAAQLHHRAGEREPDPVEVVRARRPAGRRRCRPRPACRRARRSAVRPRRRPPRQSIEPSSLVDRADDLAPACSARPGRPCAPPAAPPSTSPWMTWLRSSSKRWVPTWVGPRMTGNQRVVGDVAGDAVRRRDDHIDLWRAGQSFVRSSLTPIPGLRAGVSLRAGRRAGPGSGAGTGNWVIAAPSGSGPCPGRAGWRLSRGRARCVTSGTAARASSERRVSSSVGRAVETWCSRPTTSPVLVEVGVDVGAHPSGPAPARGRRRPAVRAVAVGVQLDPSKSAPRVGRVVDDLLGQRRPPADCVR